MTKETPASRKEKILLTATRLFAEQGFIDTSTKEISAIAEVSEALIFKHFGSKDKLLAHIIKTGYSRIIIHHKGIMIYHNAKDFLNTMILLPSKLVADEPLFWKMQERLMHNPVSRSQHENFMKPVQPLVLRAFSELGYENPETETVLLLMIIDMLWKKEALGELEDAHKVSSLIQRKYNLI